MKGFTIRGMLRFHMGLFLFIPCEEVKDIGKAIKIFQYPQIAEHFLRFHLGD
jgi:hypothetical protein